jgi:hypothetical protein
VHAFSPNLRAGVSLHDSSENRSAELLTGGLQDRLEYERRRWADALRTVYVQQKNVAAYIAFAEQTGLTVQDCHAIATLLVTRRRPREALAWIERGLHLDKNSPHGSLASGDLAKFKRELLAKLGRANEALEAAWAEFREHPSPYSYDDPMTYVPKACAHRGMRRRSQRRGGRISIRTSIR